MRSPRCSRARRCPRWPRRSPRAASRRSRPGDPRQRRGLRRHARDHDRRAPARAGGARPRRRGRRRRRGGPARRLGCDVGGGRGQGRGRHGGAGRMIIAGKELPELILGTGRFTRLETLAEAIEVTGTGMVTVALRRMDPHAQGSLMDVLDKAGVAVLPNTAGCYTARDAVRTAQLAREAFATEWIKLEVIGDERTLLPD